MYFVPVLFTFYIQSALKLKKSINFVFETVHCSGWEANEDPEAWTAAFSTSNGKKEEHNSNESFILK